MKHRKIIWILFLNIFFIQNIFAVLVDVEINESVNATQISSNQVTIITNGDVSIRNPSSFDYIFQYGFVFRDDVSLSSSFSNTNLTQSSGEVFGYDLDPNASIYSEYTLAGTISTSLYSSFVSSGDSFLEWYSEEIYFDPQRSITLSKLNRYDENSTNVSERDIVIDGVNPTNFNVKFNHVHLYKTNSSTNSEFYEDQYLIHSFSEFTLDPLESFLFTHKDFSSYEGSIYWIFPSVSALYSIDENFQITFVDESPSSGGGSGGGGSSIDLNSIQKDIIFTKLVDKKTISPGEKLVVTLQIQNPNSFSLEEIKINDNIPNYFNFLGLGNTLRSFEINLDEILPFETREINYTINYSNYINSEILTLGAARLDHSSESIFSNTVNIANNLTDLSKVVLIEKKIVYMDENIVRVIIKVQNVGDFDLSNIRIIETLGGAIVQGDLENFSRSWLIPKLVRGETWEVEYEASVDEVNFNVPQVLTAKDVDVLKTLVVNGRVDEVIINNTGGTFAGILVGMAMFLFMFDVFF